MAESFARANESGTTNADGASRFDQPVGERLAAMSAILFLVQFVKF